MERLAEVEAAEARRVGDTRQKLESARKQLKDLDDQPGWKELLADRERTSAQLQDATISLHQLDDITEAEVARLKDLADKAATELVEARATAKMDEFTDADHLARRLEQAKFNEELAMDALQNLRRNTESIEVGAVPRIPDGAEQGWSIGRLVRWPFRVFGELVFGVGQSPEEIVAILRKGFANIELLRTGWTAISKEADTEHARATKLRQALDDCIKGQAAAASPAPAARSGTEAGSACGTEAGSARGSRARRRGEAEMTGMPSSQPTNLPTLVPVTLQLVPRDGPGITPVEWETRAKRVAEALAEDEFPPDQLPDTLRELTLRDEAGWTWCFDGSQWWVWDGAAWSERVPTGILQLLPFTMETHEEVPAPEETRAAAATRLRRRRAPAVASGGRYAPTHRVPAAGMAAWSRPDGALQPEHALAAGLDVMVTEQRPDGWAHVRFSNEWEAWVDGRLLVADHP